MDHVWQSNCLLRPMSGVIKWSIVKIHYKRSLHDVWCILKGNLQEQKRYSVLDFERASWNLKGAVGQFQLVLWYLYFIVFFQVLAKFKIIRNWRYGFYDSNNTKKIGTPVQTLLRIIHSRNNAKTPPHNTDTMLYYVYGINHNRIANIIMAVVCTIEYAPMTLYWSRGWFHWSDRSGDNIRKCFQFFFNGQIMK